MDVLITPKHDKVVVTPLSSKGREAFKLCLERTPSEYHFIGTEMELFYLYCHMNDLLYEIGPR